MAFHNLGDRVFATTRKPSKMAFLEALGIETLSLDVQSEESIKSCVQEVSSLTGGSLDMLLNNAGAGYYIPLLDASIPEIEKLFDLNAWSIVRVTRHFFPLLRNSTHSGGGHVVNQTSIASVLAMPWNGPYAASKSAAVAITECLRYELRPFGIRVTELKTGSVQSNIFSNVWEHTLPESSVYAPAKEKIEAVMHGDLGVQSMDRDQWAQSVVNQLSRSNPPVQVWRGANAFTAWAAVTFLPRVVLDYIVSKTSGLDVLERKLNEEVKKIK